MVYRDHASERRGKCIYCGKESVGEGIVPKPGWIQCYDCIESERHKLIKIMQAANAKSVVKTKEQD